MKKILINPVDIETHEYRDESVKTMREGFTYLHGELEQLNGYDIFGVCLPFDFNEGVYACEVIGINKESTFYLWKGTDLRLHGLVVANDDEKSVMYAKECYELKTSVL